jgi:hypothetical protein
LHANSYPADADRDAHDGGDRDISPSADPNPAGGGLRHTDRDAAADEHAD